MVCKWRQSGLWEREGNQLSSLTEQNPHISQLPTTYRVVQFHIELECGTVEGCAINSAQFSMFFPLHVTMNYNKWELEDIWVQFFWALLEPGEPLQLYHYFVNECGHFKIILFWII